jgi:hypothetical protein
LGTGHRGRSSGVAEYEEAQQQNMEFHRWIEDERL